MEMWDIYDKDKKRTGKLMKRNDWNMKPGEFHLTVIGIVQDLEGRFLVTRRNLDKEWAAGWWELPGGGVNAGEDSKDAVIREIQEELDCTIKALQVFNDYTHEYEHIFVNLITVLCELVQGTPNANEHAELRWVSKSQLNKLNWAPADLPAVHELMK